MKHLKLFEKFSVSKTDSVLSGKDDFWGSTYDDVKDDILDIVKKKIQKINRPMGRKPEILALDALTRQALIELGYEVTIETFKNIVEDVYAFVTGTGKNLIPKVQGQKIMKTTMSHGTL